MIDHDDDWGPKHSDDRIEELCQAGLEPKEASAWVLQVSLPSRAVLEWKRKGFTPDQAEILIVQADGPEAWRDSDLTASEATECVVAGFTLEEALELRGAHSGANLLAALRQADVNAKVRSDRRSRLLGE